MKFAAKQTEEAAGELSSPLDHADATPEKVRVQLYVPA